MDMKIVEEFQYIIEAWDKLVEAAPDETFVYDGVSSSGLSRKETNDAASRVYAYLRSKGISKEDFVMIEMPRCAEVIPAMLGVLKAGAAFTIVDSHYAKERIDYIYTNCNCKFKIDLGTWEEAMNTEPLSGHEKTDPHDACFAVYTSGSTGNPKGVLHEYGDLKMIQLTAIKPYCDAWYAGGCRFGLIPPLNFVAALKFIVYGLYTGYRIYIVPTDTIKNPKKLKKFYLDHKITDSHLAPSVIRAAGSDFGPYLKRVITGSEPPNGIIVEGADLINNYTMSESAFVMAQYQIKEKEEAVPIGVPNYDGVRIHLIDENGNEVAEGETGEICIEPAYFRGYIGMPEETEKAFRGGVFHTGDLGRKREDGNYVIAGRMNDMIKINGNRVEPAEIERQAKKILGIKWCTAKGFVDEDKAFLCLYYTEDIDFDVIEVKRQFGAVLPYYMVPAYYIKLDEIPLLPNNKINKKALTKPDTANYRAEFVKPRNDLEEKLCRGFEKVLGIEQVGIKDDFFGLGGDSLAAMELLAYLDWDQLSSTDIYNGITAERIAALYMRRITASSSMTAEEYETEARKHPHDLMPTQIQILDTSLFKPKFCSWNLFSLFRIADKDSIARLCDAVNAVIRNSPICSTMIGFDEDCSLKQRYLPEKCPVAEIEHISDAEFDKLKAQLAVHTDVINSHLHIFRIFETETCGYLFINRHHISTDGMARSILYRRIADAFLDKPIPMDTYYSAMQRWEDFVEQSDKTADEKYYMERYGNKDWTIQLPHDHDLEDKDTSHCVVSSAITQEAMAGFEKNVGVTRNQLFNICMMLTLAMCTGSRNVLIPYSFHNRTDPADNEAMGAMYIQLPLGIKLDTYRNLSELYDDIRAQAVSGIQHSNYNWADVILPGRSHEAFNITYETDTIMNGSHKLADIGLEELPIDTKETYFFPNHLIGQILDTAEGFTLLFFYQINLYKKDTILKFAERFDAFACELTDIKDPAGVSVDELMKRVNKRIGTD